jgi:endonuclease/exonuclease/phosphatase family metal-dependent hydrolase
VRKGLAFTVNADVTSLRADDPWLRSGADITLHWQGRDLRLLAVHLKQGCREARLTDRYRRACPVLGAQLRALAAWVAARQAEGAAFVVLGDFNRWLAPREPFARALERAAPLTIVTEQRASPCWGGERFIDHILLGGPARAWLQRGSLHVLVYRETDAAARQRLSDHCPVSVELVP